MNTQKCLLQLELSLRLTIVAFPCKRADNSPAGFTGRAEKFDYTHGTI